MDRVVAHMEEMWSSRGVVEVLRFVRHCAREGVVIARGPVRGLNGLGGSSGRRKISGVEVFYWEDLADWAGGSSYWGRRIFSAHEKMLGITCLWKINRA